VTSLASDLSALSPELVARLTRGGFDRARLLSWAAEIGDDRDAKNRLAAVTAPAPGDVAELPPEGSPERARLASVGADALRRGEVALLVLAGGMATRMGGVVKGLVEALPGKTFLALRLAGAKHHAAKYGATAPLWLMTSEATHGPLATALGDALDGENVALFGQDVSLRLTPTGELFRDAKGEPSLYPTGHGDVPDALRRSGLLARFLAKGGKYVWIANLDNLGATIDEALLGLHIASKNALSVEVVAKAGDKGGIPVRYEDRPIICEEFRLPKSFDAATVDTFNTNTFLVNGDDLASYAAPFTYCVVEKKIDDRPAIQRERLLGELTFHLPTRFVKVPREGASSRFLPVKDKDELAKRAPDIEAVSRARGMIS
jgi:UTP--glucose-1-phosphate uridylyltransferase